MNAVLVEAGDQWLISFERIVRIAENSELHPYAFQVEGLDGLLPHDDDLVPVWRPEEFEKNGHVVLLYQGADGIGGVHVNRVMGLREVTQEERRHGEHLAIEGGEQVRWFDFDVLEHRLAALLPED